MNSQTTFDYPHNNPFWTQYSNNYDCFQCAIIDLNVCEIRAVDHFTSRDEYSTRTEENKANKTWDMKVRLSRLGVPWVLCAALWVWVKENLASQDHLDDEDYTWTKDCSTARTLCIHLRILEHVICVRNCVLFQTD